MLGQSACGWLLRFYLASKFCRGVGAEVARLGLEKRSCDLLEANDDWAWERTGEQAWEKCDMQVQEVSSDEDDDGVVKPKKGEMGRRLLRDFWEKGWNLQMVSAYVHQVAGSLASGSVLLTRLA